MDEVYEKASLNAITERIFLFVESEGLSYADFAAAIDIGAAVVSHMKNGRNKVSLNVYAKILDSFPDLNPDWLLFGQGAMYRNENGVIHHKVTKNPDLFSPQAMPDKKEDVSPTPKIDPQNLSVSVSPKQVKRIVIFYDDNSFQEFMP